MGTSVRRVKLRKSSIHKKESGVMRIGLGGLPYFRGRAYDEQLTLKCLPQLGGGAA